MLTYADGRMLACGASAASGGGLLHEVVRNQRDFDAMRNAFAHVLTYADVC